MTSVRSWMRTPRSRTRRAEAEREPRRLHGRVEAIQRAAEEERRRATRPHVVGRHRQTSSGAPSAAAARTVSSHDPSCDSVVATRSIGASRNQASTSFASHQAPTPRTASSDARQTASAAASPAFSRSVGASPQSVSQKPPFRPLGPCPQTPASSTSTSQLGLELAELPGRPEAEVAAADDDDVGPRVAFERRTRRDLSCLLEPPAGVGCGASGGSCVAPRERDAAGDDRRDGDRDEQRPEERQPSEHGPDRDQQRRARAGWRDQLADEQERRSARAARPIQRTTSRVESKSTRTGPATAASA